jgi:hypothetical protein
MPIIYVFDIEHITRQMTKLYVNYRAKTVMECSITDTLKSFFDFENEILIGNRITRLIIDIPDCLESTRSKEA